MERDEVELPGEKEELKLVNQYIELEKDYEDLITNAMNPNTLFFEFKNHT